MADLRGDPAFPLYRVRFHKVDGPDPRQFLSEAADLDPDDVEQIERRFARLDKASPQGPWTTSALTAVAERPGSSRRRPRRVAAGRAGCVQAQRAQAQGAWADLEPGAWVPTVAQGRGLHGGQTASLAGMKIDCHPSPGSLSRSSRGRGGRAWLGSTAWLRPRHRTIPSWHWPSPAWRRPVSTWRRRSQSPSHVRRPSPRISHGTSPKPVGDGSLWGWGARFGRTSPVVLADHGSRLCRGCGSTSRLSGRCGRHGSREVLSVSMATTTGSRSMTPFFNPGPIDHPDIPVVDRRGQPGHVPAGR